MTHLPARDPSYATGNAIPARALPPSGRLDSIDLLRGVVIVIMALDHVKGNLLNVHFDLTNLTQTSPIYFLTRWITHFCAPVFVFLAGTGAFLYGTRGRSTNQVAWFLFSRGLWLIFLEFTVIRLSWFLNVDYHFSVGQVIWAIGCSMIVLAGLVYLPLSAITVFGVAMIFLHNAFDGVHAADWGDLNWVWKILHTGEPIDLKNLSEPNPFRDPNYRPDYVFAPFYPLIPWVGVLATGYSLGALMLLEPRRRGKELLGMGVALTLLFIALRFTNIYGDRPTFMKGTPGPWSYYQPIAGEKAATGNGLIPSAAPSATTDWRFTVFSFVNTQKYPPSLLFLLMTLGPAIAFLGFCDLVEGPFNRCLTLWRSKSLLVGLRWTLLVLGLVLTACYIGLQIARVYEQRCPWFEEMEGLTSFDAWREKMPLSLLYLALRIGPAIAFLALIDRIFIVLGRVPLFFYLLHWYVIKGLAVGLAYQRYHNVDWMYGTQAPDSRPPEDWGYDLPTVYFLWLCVILFLFPLCRWFAGVKRRSRSAWLSYL
jgi:uncharacterized membrane protein